MLNNIWTVSLILSEFEGQDCTTLYSASVLILIDKVTDNFMFGVWGYCTSGVQNKFGIIKSHITDATCDPVWVLIDVPKVSTKYKRLVAAALSTLSAVHVLAALSTLISFLFFIITKGKWKTGGHKYLKWLKRSWTSMIVTLCLSLFTCILDFVTIITAKALAKEKGKGMATLQFGIGIWILLGATIITIFASILLFTTGCSCCGKRRKNSQGDYDTGIPLEERRHHRSEEAYPTSPESEYSNDGHDAVAPNLCLLLMMHIVFLLSLLHIAYASVFITHPYSGITCSGGSSCTVTWLDDGTAPLLSDVGLSDIALYQGTDTLVQQLASSVDVSSSHELNFIPNPEAGPNSDDYWIMLKSQTARNPNDTSLPFTSFSGFFTLDNMSGKINDPIPSLTSTLTPSITASATGSNTNGVVSTVTLSVAISSDDSSSLSSALSAISSAALGSSSSLSLSTSSRLSTTKTSITGSTAAETVASSTSTSTSTSKSTGQFEHILVSSRACLTISSILFSPYFIRFIIL
ncbi:hypothetical protein PNOK_0477700 [Pyrrhoderma noxium]|uniref:Yeast cell wall synthesis Kre9/Knh1-like N-terminal domain-containing protein n=1 Tax=Pyrrhoderma noxium TaxID=2282107 RepID=A0A286UJN6_9AGAM|nr:hypothetical protein PNOK_0477700 [Pyrrhoderma noxium]